MLLTVLPPRWTVGEFYTSCKSWIFFSFCTKYVLVITKIVLAWSNNGLNKIGVYISCSSRPCETLKLLQTQISPSFAPFSLYWLLSLVFPHWTSTSQKVLVTQSCPTLYDCIDWSPPDSSVHGILQTRILEWVAISFSRKFTKEGAQMANKHMKRHSTSFVNGEIQIKFTVKYHCMSTRLNNLQKINIIECS